MSSAAPDVDALRARQERLAQRLVAASGRLMERRTAFAARLEAHLSALNPKLVLERGYAIVAQGNGGIVRDAAQLTPGDSVQITLARGAADAQIKKTRG